MTNTLHRYGPADDLQDDFIVFAMCTRGKNDVGGPEKLSRFLEICSRHDPVNLGDSKKGGLDRPSRSLNPLAHWRRREGVEMREVVEGVSEPTTVSAVFDDVDTLAACLRDVKEADLGISINVAALTAEARRAAEEAGIRPHAVEYSLGFMGDTDRLPDAEVMSLMTMCGHGMISDAFAEKMIQWAKTRRRTPAECARYMSRFCVCGIFNPTRAERLLCRFANRADAD